MPHVHIAKPHVIDKAYEVFHIIKGAIRLTMYSHETGEKIKSVVLRKGDSAIDMGEGNGVEFIKDTILFEVKQGPFWE